MTGESSRENRWTRSAPSQAAARAGQSDGRAEAIYSFCRSQLTSDARAVAVTRAVLARAAQERHRLEDPRRYRAWLFALARVELQSSGGSALRSTGAVLEESTVTDLADVSFSRELWSVDGDPIEGGEHEFLELRFRHGLSADELGEVLDMPESSVESQLIDAQGRYERAVAPLIVARLGQERCSDLLLVLGPWGGQFTPHVRGLLHHHLDRCAACRRTAELSGDHVAGRALPVSDTRPALDLEARPVSGTLEYAETVAIDPHLPDGWLWKSNGFPAMAERRRVGGLVAACLAACISSLFAAALILLLGGSGVGEPSRELATVAEVAGAIEEISTGRLLGEGGSTPARDSRDASAGIGGEAETTEASDPPTETTAFVDNESTQEPTSTVATTSPGPQVAPQTSSSRTPSRGPSSSTSDTPSTQVGTTAALTASRVADTSVADTSTTTRRVAPTQSPTTTATTSTTSTSTSSTTSTSTTSTSTTVTLANQPPTISDLRVSPDSVASAGGRCSGETTRLTVAVQDSDGVVATVRVLWDPGTGQQLRIADREGSSYAATIGPWEKNGRQTITVVVEDNDGGEVSTTGRVQVRGCGGRAE